jgi:glycerol uptake facilitator protein
MSLRLLVVRADSIPGLPNSEEADPSWEVMMSAEVAPLVRGRSGLKARGGLWGECLAEFLGTFVLLMFGLGSVAMTVAALPGSGRTQGPTTFFLGAGDWLLIAWGWAFAVTFGVYVAGGISGAHLNPAVTLAFAVRRGFKWNKVVPYWIAQLAGAFAGAALVLLVYKDAIKAFEDASKPTGHNLATFSIFATFPAPYFGGNVWGPLIDQIVGTALLLMLIAAVVDMRNKAAMANLGPLIIGLAVGAIGISFGAQRRVRDQPCARSRTAAPGVGRRLGRLGDAGQRGLVQQLLVDPHRRPADRGCDWHPHIRPLHQRRPHRSSRRRAYP